MEVPACRGLKPSPCASHDVQRSNVEVMQLSDVKLLILNTLAKIVSDWFVLWRTLDDSADVAAISASCKDSVKSAHST